MALTAALFSPPASAQISEEQARQVRSLLADSHWVAEGPENPERVAYMFTDMECPYCARQWQAMRPFINDADNVTQVRHVIVGILKPQSHAKGAAVLAADDPLAALEKGQKEFDAGGLAPLRNIPKDISRALGENRRLMQQLGIRGTPATIFTDTRGQLQFAPGLMGESLLATHLFQMEADAGVSR
ncbi:MAG: hypothetical protein AXW13_03115 [Alcanivorax sp. Nap_24]|nr:MAG: hypothetical protein AXW13_03115 [Alcanivorax sp. Nap_24]